MILPDYFGNAKPYSLLLDGFIKNELFISPPSDFKTLSKYSKYTISRYLDDSRPAMVVGQLHVFGGYSNYYKVIRKFILSEIFLL